MKVVKKNIETGDVFRTKYPRLDESEIAGLKSCYKYYMIIEEPRPQCNPNTHKLEFVTRYEEKHPIFDHFGVATDTYDIVQLPNESIIANLNSSVGMFIDMHFPTWKQSKYLSLLSIGCNTDTEAFIREMFDWANSLRTNRDNREKQLLENNILPSFEWEPKPERK